MPGHRATGSTSALSLEAAVPRLSCRGRAWCKRKTVSILVPSLPLLPSRTRPLLAPRFQFLQYAHEIVVVCHRARRASMAPSGLLWSVIAEFAGTSGRCSGRHPDEELTKTAGA